MSKELDDFLFSPAQVQAPAAPQVGEVAPAAAPQRVASQALAPVAPVAPPAAAAVAQPPFRPEAVPMPKAAEIAPQVAAAASAAKAAAPKIEVPSPVKSLSDEVAANWVPFGIGAAGAAGAYLAVKGAKALLQNRSVRTPAGGTGSAPQGQTGTSPAAQQQRIEPVFASPEETAAHEAQARAAAEQRQRRLEEFNRMWQERQTTMPVTPPEAPAPAPATVLVDNPNRTSPWDPAQIEVPNPAVAPATPAIAEEAPKTAVAIETQQPGSKVAEAVVLDELNTPAAAQPAGEAAEPSKTVAGRTRRTKAQIDADLAAAFAAAPPGMRPAAPRKTNKLPGDVIGQGGWHFFAGQGGNPEDWLRLYGRNPQPYSRVVSDIKGGLLPIPPAPPGALGGDIPRAAYVPEFIRGRAAPGSLTGLAAIAGALGLAGSEQGREAMGRAAAAIRDIGISPDIFAGKGEELGRLGQGYVTAGNPAYLRELSKQLETEADPGRRAVLMREFQKAGGSAGGRGIAPPMR